MTWANVASRLQAALRQKQAWGHRTKFCLPRWHTTETQLEEAGYSRSFTHHRNLPPWDDTNKKNAARR